ncbi:MAG: bifunctional metallophosphatase/5'-nucleotidase [Myxococcota bacterium]
MLRRPSIRGTLISLLAVFAAGCSTNSGETGAAVTGSAALSLEVVDGIEFDAVEYEITGGDMEPMGGSIDTSAPGATASVEVFGIAPGDDYTVTMTATSTDGETSCKGSEDFAVETGVATDVMVILNCKRPPTLGAVRANGKFNICAQLTKVIVSPLQTSVGNSIDLSAEGEDAEGDELRFWWMANGGEIPNEDAASTVFICTEAGDYEIKVTVSDDDWTHCDDSWTVEVTCGDSSAGPSDRLQIIHSSDNESSFQDPNTLEEKIINYAAAVDGLQTLARQEGIASVHLTAGDHTIPGPYYQASEEVGELGEPGLADIVMYNGMGLLANGMGNHELDGGIDEFAQMVAVAGYPFLAVNLDFSNVTLQEGTPAIAIGEDGSACSENAAKVLKSCVLEVDGQRLGLIGRAPSEFFQVTCTGEEECPGLDFVGGSDDEKFPNVPAVDQVLEQVDLLEGLGINKIILLNHAQSFDSDEIGLGELRGVDIVVEAGATGFQSQPEADGPFNFLRPEDLDTAGEVPYPLVLEDSEGTTVLTINSEQLYRYVGHLIITWDSEGKISEFDSRSGPIATTTEAIALLEDEVGEPTAVPESVQSTLAALQATPSITAAFEEIGTTEFPLNGLRADVRGRETNLGRVAADSTLWYVEQNFPELGIDVALKNGGGIRDSITGPAIIQLTVRAALAFDNTLTILRLTGDQMIATMENSVSRNPAADGRFPQIAGMAIEFDPSRPGVEGLESLDTPSRVRRLVIGDDVLIDDFTAQGDLSRTFVLATNSFTATGGDGYAAFPVSEELAQTDIGEQQILEEYIVQALGGVVSVEDPPPNSRVVNLNPQ